MQALPSEFADGRGGAAKLPRSPVLGLSLEDTSVMRDAAARARTIPVVFNSVSDPIGYGLVASIARPGAISLAFSSTRKGIAGDGWRCSRKLRRIRTRAASIACAKNGPHDYFRRSAAIAAPRLAIELMPSPVESDADIERVIDLSR
jgi:putative tryptophan/tyrosine transport system substrate-binding protein